MQHQQKKKKEKENVYLRRNITGNQMVGSIMKPQKRRENDEEEKGETRMILYGDFVN